MPEENGNGNGRSAPRRSRAVINTGDESAETPSSTRPTRAPRATRAAAGEAPVGDAEAPGGDVEAPAGGRSSTAVLDRETASKVEELELEAAPRKQLRLRQRSDEELSYEPPPGEALPPLEPVPELPEGAGPVQKFLHELKPKVVTGGSPFLPLAMLAMLNVIDGFDDNAFQVLTPEIRDYFGVSILQITTIGGLIGFISVPFSLVIGYLADRVNRVWLTVGGTIVWAIMAVFTGFAWTFAALFAFRIGARIGKILSPAATSLMADYYPTKVRAGVYSFYTAANRVGNFLGPLMVGVVVIFLPWQAAFIVAGIPALLLAGFIAFRLKEPVRGVQERREAGASEEIANTGEAPPSWTESWRIAKGVRTLRRFWYALPFLVGAGSAAGTIMSLFYDEVFGLGPTARGAIQSFDEPLAFAGIAIGGVISNRLLRYRPGRVITFLGLVSVLTAASYALVAIAPVLPLAVGLSYVRAFLGAMLAPALLALMSMVIPPRARGFALATFTIFGAVGGGISILFGGLADAVGLRGALLVMTPVYLIGAFILVSAGSTVDADIRAARAAAMAAFEAKESKRRGQAKLLVCKDVDVHYGPVQILFNVDFEVLEGETIALLGTNGAGKSTLLRAISGTTPASNGAIFFDGEDITFLPPSAHAARGIIQVPGGKGVFPSLTVAENLRLAGWLYKRDTEYVSEAIESVLERFPALRARYNEPAGNMSGGEQQMLTLSQAFISRPRLLMIDELSLGLAPAVVEQLLDIVRDIAAQGTTIILVEQSVNVALTVAERAVFMEKGEIKFTGSTAELMSRPDILRSVFLKGAGGGGAPIAGYGSRSRSYVQGELAEPGLALEVENVTKSYGGINVIPGTSFTLEEGKILGLIGPNGAGKTTIFDIISGFVKPDSGTVRIFGEDVTDLSPDDRAKLGLARSFQDARLFPSLTVEETIATALERHLQSKSTIAAALHLPNVSKSERALERRIDRLIRLMNLQEFRDKFVKELSTGSRRIVDLACVMACDPKLLLLDEPSSGIAQREAEELGPVLQKIKWETGCTILIIEHDMPLLASVSDEFLALELGQVVTRGQPQEVLEHPQVVESYLGTSEEVIKRSGEVGR